MSKESTLTKTVDSKALECRAEKYIALDLHLNRYELFLIELVIFYNRVAIRNKGLLFCGKERLP